MFWRFLQAFGFVFCVCLGMSCGDDSTPSEPVAEYGSIEITADTPGGIHVTEFEFAIDGTPRGAVAANAILLVENLPVGTHRVALLNASAECAVGGGSFRVLRFQPTPLPG